MEPWREPTVREAFRSAALGFAQVVAAVPADRWDGPGLGDWTLRELVGHGARALSTVEEYLGAPAGAPAGGTAGAPAGGTAIADPVGYFVAMTGPADDADRRREAAQAIAERGRQAGRALPADPAPTVAELAERVVALVGRSPDHAVATTPAGPMDLAAYLPTRTFELAVHGLDVARASGLAVPPVLEPAVVASCGLAGRLAGRSPEATGVLLALTGRDALPAGFSVP